MRAAATNELLDAYSHCPHNGITSEPGSDPSAATVLTLVLSENQGDCMSLAMFAHYVGSFSGCPDGAELRSVVIGHLDSALTAGLLSIGDMIGSNHSPWPDAPAESIAWIKAAWCEETLASSFETLQNLCWLVNTPEGDRAAALSPNGPASPIGALQ